jgi:hypothetical protein
MAEKVPTAVCMRIEFSRDGARLTRVPMTIRAAGDLFTGMMRGLEQLRREHPNLGPSDVEVSITQRN